MASASPLDQLWDEYLLAFEDFDDLTLARWLSQTLGQLQGKVWRASHPLLGAYRLGARMAHERQVWLKRLTNYPFGYSESECCRAPALPLLTRDVAQSGLVCVNCGEILAAFESLAPDLRPALKQWSDDYAPIHAVAHWEEEKKKSAGDYDSALEDAAQRAEKLLLRAARNLAPKLLDNYPAVVWEDHDECLDVRPEHLFD